MGKVVLGMTMSLDGFINDRNGSVEVLYPDLVALRDIDPLKESIQNTGALVMGRNSFDMAEDPDSLAGNYEYQVPIFVLTHQPPKKHPKETDRKNPSDGASRWKNASPVPCHKVTAPE
jgi:dihydrofolate reductase